jgi:hypothetical protein
MPYGIEGTITIRKGTGYKIVNELGNHIGLVIVDDENKLHVEGRVKNVEVEMNFMGYWAQENRKVKK